MYILKYGSVDCKPYKETFVTKKALNEFIESEEIDNYEVSYNKIEADYIGQILHSRLSVFSLMPNSRIFYNKNLDYLVQVPDSRAEMYENKFEITTPTKETVFVVQIKDIFDWYLQYDPSKINEFAETCFFNILLAGFGIEKR